MGIRKPFLVVNVKKILGKIMQGKREVIENKLVKTGLSPNKKTK